jgi:hypothetical protein
MADQQPPFWRTVVPPGSTGIRELTTTIAAALAPGDDLAESAPAARSTARRLADDHGAADEDVVIELWNLRGLLKTCTEAAAQASPGGGAGDPASGWRSWPRPVHPRDGSEPLPGGS